jgi:hypothetical protein
MCGQQRHCFVQFDVQFHAQAAMMGLHTQVVDRDVVARSYGADTIKDALCP